MQRRQQQQLAVAVFTSVLFLVGAVALFVYGGSKMAEDGKRSLSTNAAAFDAEAKIYEEHVLPSMLRWNASLAIGAGAEPVSMIQVQHNVDAGQLGIKTSVHFAVEVELPANGTIVVLTVWTPLNIYVEEQRVTTRARAVGPPCSEPACRSSAACIASHGDGAPGVFYDADLDGCAVLQLLDTNCVTMSRRLSDAGQEVWWRDFSRPSCSPPFTAQQVFDVAYNVTRERWVVTFAVYSSMDTSLLLPFYARDGPLSVDLKDGKSIGIGSFLCALLLLACGIMVLRTTLAEWQAHQKDEELQALAREPAREEGSAVSCNTDECADDRVDEATE